MLVPLASPPSSPGTSAWSYWWSPYYKIGLTPSDNGHGWELNVNESGHQAMMPVGRKGAVLHRAYELFGPRPVPARADHRRGQRLGHAVGLRYGNGVGHIDAVEIDPRHRAAWAASTTPSSRSPTRA